MIDGGCFCGKIRYRIDGALGRASACHCSRCRKVFSGASSAYAEIPEGSTFSWVIGGTLFVIIVGLAIARYADGMRGEKIAKSYDLDLTRADFDVKMAGVGGAQVTTIDVSYEVVLKPVPGKPMTHLFALHVEGDAPRFGALTP